MEEMRIDKIHEIRDEIITTVYREIYHINLLGFQNNKLYFDLAHILSHEFIPSTLTEYDKEITLVKMLLENFMNLSPRFKTHLRTIHINELLK